MSDRKRELEILSWAARDLGEEIRGQQEIVEDATDLRDALMDERREIFSRHLNGHGDFRETISVLPYLLRGVGAPDSHVEVAFQAVAVARDESANGYIPSLIFTGAGSSRIVRHDTSKPFKLVQDLRSGVPVIVAPERNTGIYAYERAVPLTGSMRIIGENQTDEMESYVRSNDPILVLGSLGVQAARDSLQK